MGQYLSDIRSFYTKYSYFKYLIILTVYMSFVILCQINRIVTLTWYQQPSVISISLSRKTHHASFGIIFLNQYASFATYFLSEFISVRYKNALTEIKIQLSTKYSLLSHMMRRYLYFIAIVGTVETQ